MPPIPDHRLGSLAGQLLLATPILQDPNFARSVVLICEHQADAGAVGLILNRPLEVPLHSVLPDWHPHATQPSVVFHGGPVGRNAALALGRYRDAALAPGGFTPIPAPPRGPATHLGMVDVGRHPTELPGVSDVRLYHGHAGWSPGQLEAEIQQDAWFVLRPHPDDPLTPHPHDLWLRILRRQPARLALYASHPPEPKPAWN